MKPLSKNGAPKATNVSTRRTIRRRRRTNQSTAKRTTRTCIPEDPQQLDSIRPNRRLARAASNRARRHLAASDFIDIPADERRSVICDGESICYDDVTGAFKANRIERAVSWFQAIGHDTKAVVPEYLQQKVSDGYHLDNLYNQGKLIRVQSDYGTAQVNAPLERQLLNKAVEDNAAVVSEREFQSVWNESHEFRTIISERVVGFCFFKEEIFIPADPYGRAGPWLNVILKK
ncbi:protein KHNYN-like [Aedes albopictus]|uniref:RNase NYN domain-containing protein n=1 Tax=Aedes albopictus TaxID=7160 RepID=A0ABM1XJJ4_AEDAL